MTRCFIVLVLLALIKSSVESENSTNISSTTMLVVWDIVDVAFYGELCSRQTTASQALTSRQNQYFSTIILHLCASENIGPKTLVQKSKTFKLVEYEALQTGACAEDHYNESETHTQTTKTNLTGHGMRLICGKDIWSISTAFNFSRDLLYRGILLNPFINASKHPASALALEQQVIDGRVVRTRNQYSNDTISSIKITDAKYEILSSFSLTRQQAHGKKATTSHYDAEYSNPTKETFEKLKHDLSQQKCSFQFISPQKQVCAKYDSCNNILINSVPKLSS